MAWETFEKEHAHFLEDASMLIFENWHLAQRLIEAVGNGIRLKYLVFIQHIERPEILTSG